MISWERIIGLISIGIATLLLAIASFDVKGFHLIRLDFNVTSSPSVDFAVLSFCLNVQDGKGIFCSKPKVGYDLEDAEILLDDRFLNGTVSTADINELAQLLEDVDDDLFNGKLGLHSIFATITQVNTILKMVTTVFVVHIVAFAISGFCLLLTIIVFFDAVGPISCFSYVFLGFGIVASLLSGVFDIVLFVIAKQKIQQLVPPIPNFPALQVHFGKVVFLEMISFVLLLVTPIVLLIRRCYKSDRNKWRELNEDLSTGGNYTTKQR
ncbi:Pali-domain-containing protein [Mycena venus]|uniref:Pali-domain-containing protein n=1 Tax=Mycena venus TaxID=2733690 RepID=A0A8H7DAE7_9AGAR|nr:Pali-domain-containing protein [Mycena venus]